jgi:hypothetical protein
MNSDGATIAAAPRRKSCSDATHSGSATGMPPVANASGAMNETSCRETM